ncbi:PAS domain S-box protein [Desulfosarcina cetonica]|uniref:PAS domain S-box protein n=1 Tax=Desulfosarcina cetonica TaxID=90730 RepID=UPI0006D25D47|nr:PAS domain S-box protein [Desulfosarcina cetonica]
MATDPFEALGMGGWIARLLGNPKWAYTRISTYSRSTTTIDTLKIHEIGNGWAVITDHFHDGHQRTPFDGDYVRGLLAALPTRMGLPQAKVEERQRTASGPACRYRITWTPFSGNFLTRFYRRCKSHRQTVAQLIEANRRLTQKNAQLVDSERKYRYLFENGSDLLCIHDLEGNLIETNLPFKEEYGWQHEDTQGINIRSFLPDRYKADFKNYLSRVTTQGFDDGYMRMTTRSGREVTLEYRNRLVRDSDGRPVGIQAAARDVTERMRYELALRESQEKYKELVQFAPAGIFELDLACLRFTAVNDVMCQYTGYSENELLAIDPFVLLDEAGQLKIRHLLEAPPVGQAASLGLEFKRKDGEILSVIMNFKFFLDNGQPKRAMTVVHDVTAIKKTEAEKKNLENRLANAKRLESLGTLAGGVAHDLNNILSGIVSYPDLLLLDLPTDHPLRQPLLMIKKSGEKAAEIVQDLLTLARRNVGTKKVVRLEGIVNDFLASPEYRKIMGDRPQLSVQTDLRPGTLTVLGSATHISKTLMNLVANAADAMPSGGRITIRTRDGYIDTPHPGFEIIPEGEYAILEVADRGIGIAATDLEKIFEPFYTKKVMGRSGTGLGMSVVWGTLKDHGGFIDIITEEGAGTTFVLYFPGSRTQEEDTGSVYIDDYLGKGESILVVDDSPEQRDLTRRMMQRLGYGVDLAASGEEALAMIAERTFDLLVLDMIMPGGMNGLDTYKAIIQRVPNQRAIIASGYAETESVREAQQLGAGSYIKKPYTLEKIGLAVRAELDR